ncbi:MAG TPA: dihydrolipoamide acetyltransferase family protein [Solirubrobacterales bacterium]|nr:dihydrolipoamide acetyltransferase family protein [Solirubrobacterales bacterium]
MAEIVMPRLSDSMEEGTILSWLKSVGDEVAVGDEIVEIETDKANMAYESDVAGTLTEILAAEGETLAIGSPIARVGNSDEAPTVPAAGPDEGEGPAGEDVASFSDPPPRHPQENGDGDTGHDSSGGDRVKASPVARRIAKEKGIDLSTITGSGPGGRIVKKDVKKAAAAGEGAPEEQAAPTAAPTPAAEAGSPETAKGQTSYEDLSKLQSTIARRMAESKAVAPHFYLQAEIDMSRAVEARARLKASASEGDVVPSFNDMVVKACALALREHPRANGAYKDGRFELYSRVNVGVAVAGQDALVVPTVFDADKKGLRQIAADSRALAQKVRDGQITPPELSGGTFTVSNLGMYGIDNFSAVINTPQAAILAVGAIKERPVVRDGEIASAHLMGVTLACDHRILYGAPAAEFLARIRALLEEPLSLAL